MPDSSASTAEGTALTWTDIGMALAGGSLLCTHLNQTNSRGPSYLTPAPYWEN